MHGESWVNHSIQESDLLIACGMRFDDRVTGTLATYAPKAKKIHIDIDPSEINKNVAVQVSLIGDLAAVLDQILPRLRPRDGAAWLRAIDRMKGDAAVLDIKNLPDNGHLYAAHVIHDLWHATSGDALIATDVGQHQMWRRSITSTRSRVLSSLLVDWAPWLLALPPPSAPRSPVRARKSGNRGDGGFR